ncbi:uncharacterized protein LOC108740393 [Agrilus planipennis]|uniref:Uncharacterized protein LOC108740393 n=1 Tax=Agrilus planipennis TaxID=224129 RepID=A0A1W4X240_AGRPL|nr:uncharacterized protein LOC108740393 [Agrilus planipennis]
MNRLGNLFQESARKINLLNETLGRGSKIEEETIEWKKSSNIINTNNNNNNKKNKTKTKFSSHPNYFDSEDDSDNGEKTVRKGHDYRKQFNVNRTNWLNLNGFRDLTLKGANYSHLNHNHKVTFEHFKAKSYVSSTDESKITIPSEISSCDTLIAKRENLDVLKKDALNMQLQLKEKKKGHGKIDPNKKVTQSKFRTMKQPEIQHNDKIKSRTTSSATVNINGNKTFYIDCHKMLSLLEKSITFIESIEQIIDIGIEPPDGSEDYKRKRKRAVEFASRFSRNYLYTLGRQRADLLRLTSCGKHTYRTKTLTAQKIVSASQIILQALQAYLHYLPSCLPDSLHEKLQELIKHSLEICNVYSSFVEDSPYVNDKSRYLVESFRVKFGNCLEKLQQISNNIMERNNNLPLACTKVSLHSTKESVKSLQLKKKKKALAARLSMYKDTTVRRDAPWRKAVEALARQRLKYSHVKSRYKTFVPKHRQSEEMIEVQNKFPPPQPERKPIPHMLKNTPLSTPVNEDRITTMVELENNRNHKEVHQHDKKLQDLIINIQQLVQEIDKKEDSNKSTALLNGFLKTNGEKVADNNPQHESSVILENLALQLHKYCNKEKQTMEQKNDENEDKIHDDELSREKKKGSRDSHRSLTPNKKDRIVSITGPKNAKLIHMVRNEDDASEVEASRERHQEIDTNNCNDQAPMVCGDEKPKKVQTKTKGGLIRLKASPLKQLDLLPKNEVVEIVKYKVNYSKFSKCSCMYRKSSKMQPWILLRNVSEKLFRELLMSIVRELEMPQLLEKMYLSEFQ